MKKYLVILGLFAVSLSSITSCKQSDFDEYYRDPASTTETTIDRQFTGIFYSVRELVMPSYWNYFVIMRTTTNRYLQVVGWANEQNQLTPGAAAISDRWNTYYAGLAQYKEFENVYQSAAEAEQQEKRIYYLAAKIFFYDQTQQIVDLHGDIPWSQAGTLSGNGGDYSVSYPAYDRAEDIYTAMLDDLSAISTELNSLTISSVVQTSFSTQDIINGGSLDAWKLYCNSLRLRMLTRVQEVPVFSSRAQQELTEIISNPASYPVVTSNEDNIEVEIFDNTNEWIHARGFRTGIEDWNSNIASGVMIDQMLENEDPRLPFMFEPGAAANGEYIGLDQSLTSGVQTQLITGTPSQGSTLAIYNRATYSRNQRFPAVIITASEVNFLLAEYYARNGNDGAARSAFETGIRESIEMLQNIRSNTLIVESFDNAPPNPSAPTATAINNYIANIGWGTNNIQLIATQKWLHFNIIQPIESWAENRRLDYPVFNFVVQPSDNQQTVPVKWNLPASEPTYNAANYQAVQSQDNVNTRVFWDVN